MSETVERDDLILWGSDCTACGNTTPGSMICDGCGTNANTVGLWQRVDPLADIAANLADENEPIHAWFNLTYANYLVLPRSVLQSMPVTWQRRFVTCLRQLDRATEGHVDIPMSYEVQCRGADGRFVADPVPHYNRGRTRLELSDIE